MTVRDRPATSARLGGASIELPPNPCVHDRPQPVRPWRGEPGSAGTVAVVGAGKMGLPLAAQFAAHWWDVLAVDIDERVVQSINEGRSHVGEEPGVAELVARTHQEGRLRATTDAASAAAAADVVVLIVPIMLDDEMRPDRRWMDAAVDALLPGLRPGTLVIFETTLPVGDTRSHYGPRLEQGTGLSVSKDDDSGLHVAFSPERLYSGAALRNLATYPKLVGGLTGAATARAAVFYQTVIDADIVAMSSAEAAEFAKLADTTYRDVNIALSNQFAMYADRLGVDITEVIEAANSQPYSHIHDPGLGVGGHCIPVYPHFLLHRDPELTLVAEARRANDGQVERVVDRLGQDLASLEGASVLVLGLTYRYGVKELAYSRALPLIAALRERGAHVLAWDPLLEPSEILHVGARPWAWGTTDPSIRAVITQTADPVFRSLDPAWLPALEVLVDGRNSLRDRAWPTSITYRGIGVPGTLAPAPRGTEAARRRAPEVTTNG